MQAQSGQWLGQGQSWQWLGRFAQLAGDDCLVWLRVLYICMPALACSSYVLGLEADAHFPTNACCWPSSGFGAFLMYSKLLHELVAVLVATSLITVVNTTVVNSKVL